MRSVMIGLVAVAVLLGGCSDEENTGPVSLEVVGPKTTDEELAEKLKGLTKLKWLDLNGTKVCTNRAGTLFRARKTIRSAAQASAQRSKQAKQQLAKLKKPFDAVPQSAR